MSLNLQELILNLSEFWSKRGTLIQQGYDIEVGAGTMHPDTFFRVLGPEPWRVAFVQPSRRPGDGRYGENPMRVFRHHQMQVILKPAPEDVQDIFLESLTAFGIDPRVHDIRFEEDNWESPTLGAAGVGWQVLMDGMEITQFTYFQQAGGQELSPVSAELTYGLERITMFLNGIRNIYEIPWGRMGDVTVPYGEVRRREEIEHSTYAFEAADKGLLLLQFEQYESECTALLDREQPLLYPAYDLALKCSHAFNLLDARGAISVTERAAYIQRIRALAIRCASRYREIRYEAGLPLLPPAERERHLAAMADGARK
jgi:glycyl-tRNA synthetase alpha chain